MLRTDTRKHLLDPRASDGEIHGMYHCPTATSCHQRMRRVLLVNPRIGRSRDIKTENINVIMIREDDRDRKDQAQSAQYMVRHREGLESEYTHRTVRMMGP